MVYEAAVKGKNGFVCVVERSWGPISTIQNFGTPEFGARSVTTRQPRDASCS
jgi:hypothetical protein